MTSVHAEVEYTDKGEGDNQGQTEIDDQFGSKPRFVAFHCLPQFIWITSASGKKP